MSERGRILSAGRIYCDLVFTRLDDSPAPGREVFAEGLSLFAGGGAYITAAYLSALGHGSGLIGTLPASPFDAIVLAEMAANGVTSFCRSAPQDSDPQITVAMVHGADRAFVTRRSGKALRLDGALPAARHLHLGEITTARDHPELIAAARAAGMTLSLDCSWDARALSDRGLADVIAAVDLFFPNEAELAELLRHGIPVAPRVATVLKQGARGAELRPAKGMVQHCPALKAEVQDTTGAGDAFNAGFLSAWLDGQSGADCLARGAVCGAIAVARVGGAGALPPLHHLSEAARVAQP